MSHRARKRFGQNFLQDRQVIQRIIQSVNPQPGQRLVEIGPGQGAITLPLLRNCGRLEVVELDRDLIEPLREKTAGHGEIVIHQRDALQFDFSALAQQGKVRIVGNLPYNISTPLIFHLIDQAGAITDMHFMLQKEVVARMAAQAGEQDYGRLSVMVQYHCQVQPLFRVAAEAFSPVPKVESAFVRLIPHAVPPAPLLDPACLANVVRQAFSQRRKTLRNTLRSLLDSQEITAAGCDPGARAETVTLRQFAALADRLALKNRPSN